MRKKSLKKFSFFLIGGFLAFLTFFIILPEITASRYNSNVGLVSVLNEKIESKIEEKPKVLHLPTPEPLKTIYMTACVVGTPSLRNSLVKLVEETEINSIIIDIKDFSGTLAYPPENPDLKHAWEASKCGAPDMKEFVASLKEKGIYTIARLTVFQDPHYTKLHPELAVRKVSDGGVWKDRKGLAFLDVGGKQTWDYVVSIARDASQIGFDEINFDYIRFPSDGNMADAKYTLSIGTKSDQLEKFFQYLNTEMKKDNIVTSADLFGMTTTNTDDLNIGQVLEKTMPYFDYVAPMVYPSHYPKGFNGWSNPNNYVYDLIHFVMKSGVKRTVATSTIIKTIGSEEIFKEALSTNGTTTIKVKTGLYTKESYPASKLRTWIQDFDYGGNYDIAEIKAQIRASVDAGVDSYMIWSPSNKYTRGALQTVVSE